MAADDLKELRDALRPFRGDIDRVSPENLVKALDGYRALDALTHDELNIIANRALTLQGPPPGGWNMGGLDLKALVR